MPRKAQTSTRLGMAWFFSSIDEHDSVGAVPVRLGEAVVRVTRMEEVGDL